MSILKKIQEREEDFDEDSSCWDIASTVRPFIKSHINQTIVEVLQELGQVVIDRKVIMWNDEPAQHIRNIQNNETLEGVAKLIESTISSLKQDRVIDK